MIQTNTRSGAKNPKRLRSTSLRLSPALSMLLQGHSQIRNRPVPIPYTFLSSYFAFIFSMSSFGGQFGSENSSGSKEVAMLSNITSGVS